VDWHPCRLRLRGAEGGGAATTLPQVVPSPAVRSLVSFYGCILDLIAFFTFLLGPSLQCPGTGL
jgi:hypothetical protein